MVPTVQGPKKNRLIPKSTHVYVSKPGEGGVGSGTWLMGVMYAWNTAWAGTRLCMVHTFHISARALSGESRGPGHQAAGSGPLDRKHRPEKAQVSVAALRLYGTENSSFTSVREISVAVSPPRKSFRCRCPGRIGHTRRQGERGCHPDPQGKQPAARTVAVSGFTAAAGNTPSAGADSRESSVVSSS